jgi:hypothetical protein
VTGRSIFALLLCAAPVLLGDGGAVLAHRTTGPFTITVFASPVPLRTGTADVSVLVQESDTPQPVLDAMVSLQFQSGESVIAVHATREQAQNKLFYASAVNLETPGEWQYSINVSRGSASASLSGTVTIAPAPPVLAAYWSYLALPPVFILIFALHQSLRKA